jgi:hypothetical protein
LDEEKGRSEMKKFQTVVLALFAVLACGALFASAASAETTLAAEWLHNGAAVTTTLPTEAAGSLALTDTVAKVTLLCKGILDGNVSAAGKDETIEVLNAAKEKIELGKLGLSIAKGDCTNVKGCPAPAEVWPEGLPWKTQLFLRENGTFADSITGSGTGGTFGYTSLCTIPFDIEDTCTATKAELTVENDLEDAAVPAGAKVTPNANCTIGGKEAGENVADELTLISLVNGELLTASE